MDEFACALCGWSHEFAMVPEQIEHMAGLYVDHLLTSHWDDLQSARDLLKREPAP